MKEETKYRPLGWLMKGIARLPFPVLYFMADAMALLLTYVIGYRRGVIYDNLSKSFPEKSDKEIKRMRRQFYRNFADYVVETIKLLHISDSQMRSRMTFSNLGIIDDALDQRRPVVCYFSHLGNWEWAPSITLNSRHTPGHGVEFCQIYRPLRNKWFDSMMLRIRSRFGSVSLPKRRSFLDIMRYTRNGIATVTGFMSDQKPSHGDPVHVVKFLNHPTAIITGTETVCSKLKALPVYWRMSKPSRGHYHIDVVPMEGYKERFPDSDYPLTDLYASMLEENITADPPLWLWSHKRWKIPVSYPSGSNSQPQSDK